MWISLTGVTVIASNSYTVNVDNVYFNFFGKKAFFQQFLSLLSELEKGLVYSNFCKHKYRLTSSTVS